MNYFVEYIVPSAENPSTENLLAENPSVENLSVENPSMENRSEAANQLCQTLDFNRPIITFYLDLEEIKCEWSITNLDWKFIDIWKNMRMCMILNKESEHIGGRGAPLRNSSWSCKCNGNEFIIEYNISKTCTNNISFFIIKIPNTKMIPCIDKIIDILEYAKLNKRYPDSTIFL
jgi:hypothetical protein